MNSVKVKAITMPVDDELSSSEDFIAYAARVSNPSNQLNTETSSKLLKYLVKHKHWSPFEMATVVMEINTTRDIARQILRHRSFAFQEFSQRYADPNQLGFQTREARLQDEKNRQASIEVEDTELLEVWEDLQTGVLIAAKDAYRQGMALNIAKEQLRTVLPEGLTNSRLYMSGTVRSWIHYCQIRTDPATQLEHREIALMAQDELLKWYPSLKSILLSE